MTVSGQAVGAVGAQATTTTAPLSTVRARHFRGGKVSAHAAKCVNQRMFQFRRIFHRVHSIIIFN